jgi:acetate kinase
MQRSSEPFSSPGARVLCVNLGSRTAKLSVVRVGAGAELGHAPESEVETETDIAAVDAPATFAAVDIARVDAVAYRVVRIHQLPTADAVLFDDATRAAIAESAELAPLHTRSVLDAFDTLRRSVPHAAHVAVFDAGFHRTIPDRAAVYGLPYEDALAGWRKVGFHGLSYAYASARAAVLLGAARTRKLVALHLGGGCSACAIDDGRSVETTMGFTPTDGLLMATRSGSVDIGLMLAYMRKKKLSIDEAEAIVSERSGLLGLGGSSDMREIEAARARGDGRATLAYDVFVHKASAAVGAMSAALHGLDAMAFTGGIGEHDATARERICAPFAFLGVTLDDARNREPAGDAIVSRADARVTVLRIRAREDWSMALAASHVVRTGTVAAS